jgi:hypothetical protein
MFSPLAFYLFSDIVLPPAGVATWAGLSLSLSLSSSYPFSYLFYFVSARFLLLSYYQQMLQQFFV